MSVKRPRCEGALFAPVKKPSRRTVRPNAAVQPNAVCVPRRHTGLRNSVDEMQARVRINDIAYFPHLKSERSVFEGLLHHSSGKEPEITSFLEGTAVAVLVRKLRKVFLTHTGLQRREIRVSLFLRLGHSLVRPAGDRVSRLVVFYKQVQAAHLIRCRSTHRGRDRKQEHWRNWRPLKILTCAEKGKSLSLAAPASRNTPSPVGPFLRRNTAHREAGKRVGSDDENTLRTGLARRDVTVEHT